MEWRRDGGYVISDDASRVDIDLVHRWLAEEAYWAKGRPHDVVVRSLAASLNLGVYSPGGSQVAFCRWVTDGATFAWLCDVFVDRGHRGSGIGTWLVEVAVAHPAVAGVKRKLLATQDAHDLYAKVGFERLRAPERWMELLAGTSGASSV
jgi:GNAT superfamily N-acetyltransferase